jgi:predicted  nucleic acid-binding Zn-ribbon protein
LEGSDLVSFVQPLLELQDVDGRIRELEQEIVDIPKRKEQENARLNDLRKLLEATQSAMKTIQVRIDETDLETQGRKDKINDLKKHQVMLKTNKEFQSYNKEITKLEDDIGNFEAREIIAMDDLIPVKAKVTEIKAKLTKEQTGVDEYMTELDQRLSEINEVLTEARKEREEVAKGVDPRPKLYYDRLRIKRWPAVVKLQNGSVCSGCNLVQPPSVGQMVRRDKDVVVCTMCGRILYMEH